ncbi:phage virion morphogenesis protein [Phocoenobacter skyensis]|uniref:Phage virion morphogenesis protein n=1 Tax=Phocoenobacter skyensis TaxID=97481 RepID=A0ABT9JKR4_9PAST|nr:phage virion morphogenesis protein [Pasteurella skyensis]MDP8079523.1 phage virion morphogenesis protein [Pasteurella skyensis]MDP8085395.1 phage virion morphogenesis protein [Pasteurella skyensis]
MTIHIKLENADKIIKTLNNIAQKTEQRTELMTTIADTMQKAVLDNFEAEGRPKWLGIKHRKGQILNDTGNLKNSIEKFADNDSATVGTIVEYAAIHQFGGMAGRNKKVKIPARPFVSLVEQDRNDIIEDIQQYYKKVIK